MKQRAVGTLLSFLLVFAAAPLAWAGEPGIGTIEPDPVLTPAKLRIGSVEGWTTQWHPAPAETAIPVGTEVRLSLAVPKGTGVRWQEAVEVARSDAGSIAECTLSRLGTVEVWAEVTPAKAAEADPVRHGIRFHVFDPAEEPIRIAPVSVTVVREASRDEDPGSAALAQFFSDESVAGLRRLGPGRYRTSLGRTVQLSVEVTPAALAPLIEWRVDGRPSGLGRFHARAFTETGVHRIEAGPTRQSRPVEVETYSVRITGGEALAQQAASGRAATFHAETVPPGLEEEVTWIAATKFGQASPATGRGESFTVRFEDAWGELPDGTLTQWIGVKADHNALGLDQEAEVQRLATSAYVTIRVPGLADFEIYLQGAGPGDTVVRLDSGPYQPGQTIETEILSLDLHGAHAQLGPVILQLDPAARSFGSVSDVQTDADGAFLKGEGSFQVLPRIFLPDFGLELHTGGEAVHLTSIVTGLPPLGAQFTSDATQSVPLYADNALVGEITSVTHEVEECDCPDAPEVDDWNGEDNGQEDNNCYNYATNQQNGTFAQPGDASGNPFGATTCDAVGAAAAADGLSPNGDSTECPPNTCLVALYVEAGVDFHWYRKNDNGQWSHKPGETEATTQDNQGNEIGCDLGNADTGGYVFCQYMCAPWDVTVKRPTIVKASASGPDVQILVRSGRLNPGWTLTDPAEIAFIQSALQGLPSASDPAWPSQLGYRGFGIFGRTDLGLPPVVRVWNGVIQIQDGPSTTYFDDIHGLEDFLTQGAIARGLGSEIP